MTNCATKNYGEDLFLKPGNGRSLMLNNSVLGLLAFGIYRWDHRVQMFEWMYAINSITLEVYNTPPGLYSQQFIKK